jgi:hypothetical protein
MRRKAAGVIDELAAGRPQDEATRGMRDHAHTLSDFRVPSLSIECEPCGRRGRYNIARLMEKYGDAKLPELLTVLADCPKARSQSVYDRCKAVYGKDSRWTSDSLKSPERKQVAKTSAKPHRTKVGWPFTSASVCAASRRGLNVAFQGVQTRHLGRDLWPWDRGFSAGNRSRRFIFWNYL